MIRFSLSAIATNNGGKVNKLAIVAVYLKVLLLLQSTEQAQSNACLSICNETFIYYIIIKDYEKVRIVFGSTISVLGFV